MERPYGADGKVEGRANRCFTRERAETGIRIETAAAPRVDLYAKSRSRLPAGEGPDLARINTGEVAPLRSDGVLEPSTTPPPARRASA